MRKLSLAIVLLAGLGAGCSEESEEAPLQPSYEHDVKPLMGARCIRCHGAGGTLNPDPDIAPVNNSMVPKQWNLTQLGSDANGVLGLMSATGTGATFFIKYIDTLPMPPPPSPPLTERERTILVRWLANPLP